MADAKNTDRAEDLTDKMAQFITLPQAQPTGYGQLGQVLLAGAADYAADKRRTAEEDRVRANQLADAARNRTNALTDVQSARDYTDRRYSIERGDRLKDTEAEKLFAAKTEMMRLGYLTPDKFDDEAAVKLALTKMHSDGLLQKYQGALSSGDLTYEDLSSGDEKRISAGLAKFSARLGKETTRQETSVGAAQDTANSLQAQYDQSQAQAAALEQELARPVEESVRAPSQQEVQNLAVELARQTTGGKQPSAKDIAAQFPVAQQQLQQQHLESAMLRKQQTQERVRLLKDQAQSLGVRLNTLATRGIFPVVKAAAAPSPLTDVTLAPALTPAASGARQAAMQATIAKARGTPGGSPVADAGQSTASRAPLAPAAPAGYGGLMGLGASIGNKISGAASSAAGTVSDAVRYAPGTLNMLAGGEKRFQEGEAERAAPSMFSDDSPANIEAENEVLRGAPYSARAYEIRARRGLPQPPNPLTDTTASPPVSSAPRVNTANGSTPFPGFSQNPPWWAQPATVR